ncbi:MAG: sugar phosphate isomerase/epimerase [Tetragenococcus koreensis]|uniref:sugar phosphate isomerase/epimerase family protein n=1 Tax=Tetragenococcus halophilus TaxID=51669 RepID=UPI00077C37E0|nr:TIM barrel protein [Tetragenococcus halophilus]MDN6140152.1 sugar phosphate isomerase/epimerase [Tetragenococcus koreensis]MCO8289177.1 sugar phosphate isomerase/epimerase [Tetragenococcus halophilus]MDN6270646.1 sugar phosphate isomerase/epimerase [Tetragenococcus koreensis]MDN6497409.1 sugar phosphate isomerase/epimerase [Tetragenococcus koreensis]MDN6502337.1 sugar phosphate isomerase/epimerase [Tetragenococcus koreensis]
MSLIPSILFNNVFDPISRNEAEIMSYYRDLYDIYEYKSLETRLIFDKEIRKEFAEFVSRKNVSVTIWSTSNLNNKKLYLADPDEEKRQEAVRYMKEIIDLSVESNAEFIGFTSGKKILSNLEMNKQIQNFEKSIIELIDYVEQYEQIELLLEPLDTDADKKFVVGSTDYVLDLFERLEEQDKLNKLSVCIDTAHIVLNNECVIKSMKKLSKYSQRIHLANVVLNQESELFGDKHLRVGTPGFLTQNFATQMLDEADGLKFRSEKVYVAIEVRGQETDDLFKLEKENRKFLFQALTNKANNK